MYPHQQGGSSSYDYSSYSASPYEQQAPPAQAAGRAVRSGTSQTHSPQHQPDYPSSSSYASSAAYSTAPYNISSSHTQQWQPDSWAAQQYAPFASQAMQTEVSYATATPRTDQPVTISPPDARAFAPTTLNQTHEPRRQDSGYIPSFPASSHTSSPPRNRRRDKESPMVGPAPTAAPGLDFLKLQDSYRFLLDGTNSLIGNGAFASSRPPPVETIDRMMQSATYGMQMLQSVVAQSNPDMRPMTGGVDKDAPAPKRQKGDEHAQEGQTCLGCNATSTPEWRRGPLGPRTLCNACGLVYAKLLKKRARGEARSRAGDNAGQSSQHTMDETGVASSEDEDSYGSQERRSDFGDHGRRA